MYYTYVLYSESKDMYYVGYTQNLDLRLQRHNDGWSKFTKSGTPWKLVYSEEFKTKSEAIKREYEIKRMKSRVYIEDLLKSDSMISNLTLCKPLYNQLSSYFINN